LNLAKNVKVKAVSAIEEQYDEADVDKSALVSELPLGSIENSLPDIDN
jgi:hypothetical protein